MFIHRQISCQRHNQQSRSDAECNHQLVDCQYTAFHFILYHISVDYYTDPHGLFHQPPMDNDPPNQDDFRDWLDDSYSCCITVLNNQTEPPAAIPIAIHTCPHTPYLPSLVSLSPDTPLLFPFLCICFCFLFQARLSTSLTLYSLVCKGQARKAWIHKIHGFLNTCECPADLSDTDFQSFVKSATKFCLLQGSLWYQELHRHHQLVVLEHWKYGLIKKALSKLIFELKYRRVNKGYLY